ncbi:MAG: hypothetical protein ABIZ64_18610 [Casimicrobium sp.]|jgi:hypothetical protein
MSAPTAKELLAQADRLMRQRTPEELPVLTDLVIEEIEIPSLSDRMDEVIPTHSRPSWMPALPVSTLMANPATTPAVSTPLIVPAALAPATSTTAPSLERSQPVADLFAGRSRPQQEALSVGTTFDSHNSHTPMLSAREQFNEQLLAKMEELQHSVFSQVMQKLEISASGSLKAHLRQTLEPALLGIARDLAEQVAEDTATQVRQVVSDAVDAEIARLRAQFAKKRL